MCLFLIEKDSLPIINNEEKKEKETVRTYQSLQQANFM